ncbi:MAG: M67 family metallopeptidase [Planctomycetaceae bacterium]|nr:M67 family metallopeptidase [Planctomycetaceae bacterium]
MLYITQQQKDAVNAHAAAEYPNECCGAILGHFDNGSKTVRDILPISNQREDSAKHNRFLITPQEFMFCEKTARKANCDVVGFYHSHPDHPSAPSRYDLEHALPVYSYVIVSVAGGQPDKMTSWELQNDRSMFNEEQIQ